MKHIEIQGLETQDNETQDLKLRLDGSIDLAYYMKIGHEMRSEQAHKIFKSAHPSTHLKGRIFAIPRWVFGAFRRAGGTTIITQLKNS